MTVLVRLCYACLPVGFPHRFHPLQFLGHARNVWTLWEQLNREAAEARARRPAFDRRPIWVLLTLSLVLIFEEYFGDRPNYQSCFPSLATHRYDTLFSFSWWAGAKVIGYLLAPVMVLKLLGLHVRDHGLGARGVSRHLWICVVAYLAMLPVVVAASYTPSFRAAYPLYQLAGRSGIDFVVWELEYAITFVALEFFFRGFALFALEPALGAYAIFVMAVPYCMLHFNKPLAEACGAIVAGVALGTLALRTRSIWCGVVIHISVAWTMDLLALAQASAVR